MKQLVHWDSKSSFNRHIRLNIIDDFGARGKRCLYSRGDRFPGKCTFNMTIWKDKNGRLLVRFWSRSMEVDWRSFELIGILPEFLKSTSLDEKWIPQALRKEYDEWIKEEW